MSGINKRSTKPGNGQKKITDYDTRVRSYYGHEAQDLKSRETLLKRGVRKSTPNLPSADYTMDGPDKLMKRRKRK